MSIEIGSLFKQRRGDETNYYHVVDLQSENVFVVSEVGKKETRICTRGDLSKHYQATCRLEITLLNDKVKL